MGKVMNTVGAVMDTAANITINVGAAAAGGTVAAYVINHDVCNDEDMSLVAGTAGGVATFCVVRGAVRSVKDGVKNTSKKIYSKLTGKSKRGSVK